MQLKRAKSEIPYVCIPVLTDILCATILPPITAKAVQKACPRIPPSVTPTAFYQLFCGNKIVVSGFNVPRPNTKLTRIMIVLLGQLK